MIPYGRQKITQEDIDAVVRVLKSDFLTQGPETPIFELAISQLVGVKYAAAVNSATSALHIACLALGAGKGDIVWTSPISFVASANCALYCGAAIDFVDIDIATANMCVVSLREKLVLAKKRGTLPKIVIPVHFSGESCDMAEIYSLSKIYGFKIIEDASHAIGGEYRQSKIGSCRYSDVAVFSFHPVKIITCGEGGMVLTNDEKLAKKINLLRSHGVTRTTEEMVRKDQGSWFYEQVALGYNYRITDIQTSLGLSQLKRISENTKRRHEIAEFYDREFFGSAYAPLVRKTDCTSGLHLYVLKIKDDNLVHRRKDVVEYLRRQGVGVNVHYIPIHLQPYYKKIGFNAGDFPNAENYYSRCFSIPMFPELESKDLGLITNLIKNMKL